MPYQVYTIITDTPNHIYIGATSSIFDRIAKHFRGAGSKFTQTHGTKRCHIKYGFDTAEEAKKMERELVIDYTKRGWVACGGGFSSNQHLKFLKQKYAEAQP